MNIMNNVKNVFKNTRRFIVKYSPEIMTGVGLTGMVMSTVLAVKATPKAMKLIEEHNDEELTFIDKTKIAWKPYMPAISVGLASSIFIIGAGTINHKRNAALTTAYALSEGTLLKYRNKVIETLGEKKEHKIRNEISQDMVNDNKKVDNQVIITSKGNTLFMDSVSGRYFRSDIDTIKKVVNELNRKMTYENYISLSDFYYEIGLQQTKNSDDLGWNLNDGLIEIVYNACISENDEPCIVLDYLVAPRFEYDKLM